MSDQATATETEANAEAAAAAASQDTGPLTEEAAEAEEKAAWAEVIAAEKGEDPPATDDKNDTSKEAGAAAAAASGERKQDTEAGTAADGAPGTASASSEVDIWAEAPEELRSAHEAEVAARTAAERGKAAADGRVSALQRRLDAVMADGGGKPAAEATRTRQPEGGGTEGAATEETVEEDPELKAFEDEYPEIAQGMRKMVGRYDQRIETLEQENARLRANLQTVGEERVDAHSAEQEASVLEAHPDFDQIADSDDFVEWAQGQPEFIQREILENAERVVDGAATSRILTMYKADRGIVTETGDGSGAGEDAGERKPAADPIRTAQLRSAAGGPRPSPGAQVTDRGGRRTETEADVWAELRRDEEAKQKRERAAA